MRSSVSNSWLLRTGSGCWSYNHLLNRNRFYAVTSLKYTVISMRLISLGFHGREIRAGKYFGLHAQLNWLNNPLRLPPALKYSSLRCFIHLRNSIITHAPGWTTLQGKVSITFATFSDYHTRFWDSNAFDDSNFSIIILGLWHLLVRNFPYPLGTSYACLGLVALCFPLIFRTVSDNTYIPLIRHSKLPRGYILPQTLLRPTLFSSFTLILRICFTFVLLAYFIVCFLPLTLLLPWGAVSNSRSLISTLTRLLWIAPRSIFALQTWASM